jgi:hypothetical protein
MNRIDIEYGGNSKSFRWCLEGGPRVPGRAFEECYQEQLGPCILDVQPASNDDDN